MIILNILNNIIWNKQKSILNINKREENHFWLKLLVLSNIYIHICEYTKTIISSIDCA